MSTRQPIIGKGEEAAYERFHFAPAFRIDDTIYVSGIIGRGVDGRIPDTAAEEFTAAFAQLAATLEAAGSSVADIVELTSFHVDMAEIADFIAAKDAVIAEPYPAWTAVGTTALVERRARAEVKATAVISRNPDNEA